MKRNKLVTVMITAITVMLLATLLFLVACSSPTPAPTTAKPTTAIPTTAAPSTTAPTTTAPASTTAAPTTSSAPQTLKIGALFGLTGFFSDYDSVQSQEADIAVAKINSEGGVKVQGQQYNIQLISYDFKSTMDGVVSGTNQLVFQDKVKYMLAPSAFFSPASKDITEPNKVFRGETMITGTAAELGPGMDYTFLGHSAHFDRTQIILKYLKANHPEVKTLAYLYPDDGTQEYIFSKDKVFFDKFGYTNVGGIITFDNAATDFSPIASKVIATKADAMFFGNGIVFHAGNFLKTMRQMGSKMLIASTLDASPSDVMAIAQQSNATGYFSEGFVSGAPNTPPLMQQYLDLFASKYGTRSAHMQTVNVLYMIKQAIEKANSLDTTVVKDTLAAMDTIDTPYGPAHLGGLQTYGIKHAFSHQESIWEFVDGQAKFGGWFDPGAEP
jgi:branched-chain amino acid transport system substrate-binding protein